MRRSDRFRPISPAALLPLVFLGGLQARPVAADETPTVVAVAEPVQLDGVQVRGESQRRTVKPATQTTVIEAEDIRRLNVRTVADLFQKVPGAQSHTFGQGDIGHPLRLRGFNGEHGRDVAIIIDGVPQNTPSGSSGGHGNADYSWLTPDMIERIEVVQGPATALAGDQALSGAVFITTRTRAKSSVNVRAGSYGDTQLSSVFGQRLGEIDVLGVAELTRRDGYRANSDYDRVNVFLKGSKAISSGVLSARASHYSADWSAPGYIPFAAYQAGTFAPTDSLFESDGGRGRKTSLVITHAPAPGNGLTATAYYENIRRSRFGTFGTAPQNEQDDLRNVFGSKAYYTWEFEGRGDLNVGYEYRHDNGVNGQFQTVRRARNGVVSRDYKFDIDAISFYTEGSVRPWQRLKLLGGLRYDIFRQDIFNRLTPSQSGDGSQTIASPHVGLVFEAIDGLELFANYGTGFRSLQVTELSPVSATRPQGFDLTPPQVRARDTGLRLSMGAAMVNVSVYTATVADEIQETAPGSNVFANIGNTKRQGYQVDGRLEVMPGLSLTAAYSHVHARVINPAIAGRDRVDSNPRSVISAGVQHSMPAFGGAVLTDFFLQQVGAKPYYINNVLFETTPYQENNLRVAYERGHSAIALFGVWRPRDFASDQAGSSFNPQPNFEYGASYRYTF